MSRPRYAAMTALVVIIALSIADPVYPDAEPSAVSDGTVGDGGPGSSPSRSRSR